MIDYSEESESLVPALARLDATDALAARLSATYEHARELNLRVFPALPAFEDADVVEVSADRLKLADFIALAAELGARLLYVDAERFSIGDLPAADHEDEQDRDELDKVRFEAARFDGHVVGLEVAFAHDRVWHVWNEAAPAAATLAAATSSSAARGQLRWQQENEGEELTADEHTRLGRVL